MSFWCYAYTDGLWFWALNFTSALLVIATQALAVFCSLFSCVEYYYQYSFHGRVVRRYPWRGYISGASHVCTGVLCLLSFPVRHFVEIGQNLLYGNYGYAYMWGNAACLLLFLIPPLLLLPHLKRSLISRKYDDIE